MKKTNRLNDLLVAAKQFIRKAHTIAFLILFTLSCMSFTAIAAEKNVTATEQSEARVLAIKDRVNEIRAMDMKHMTRTERKDVKAELKDMNKELRQMHPTYVYISGGGLLLIILILILIL
jgi:DNA gyrase/topoisomerase IV subunit A